MSKIAVGDADSLIALADNRDSNHARAVDISNWLLTEEYDVIYPNTAILESITALKRAKNLPEQANLIAKQYMTGAFAVEFISEAIQQRAAKRFITTASKQHTIFDCVVAAVAEELHADYIFSFDNFYRRQGFLLIEVPSGGNGKTLAKKDL